MNNISGIEAILRLRCSYCGLIIEENINDGSSESVPSLINQTIVYKQ